jgi:glycosyltransferase involved in cell wall biosynthesis
MYPLVSILIPVFNREKYIAECIESAKNQSISDIEIIIVDNASTDKTPEICQKYAEEDSRIRYFQNSNNIGPVRNWLACASKARGIYTKILWSDDVIEPLFLERLLPFLGDSSVGFVYSAVSIFSENKKDVITSYFLDKKTGIYDSRLFVEGALFEGTSPGSPGCAIFRTDDIKKNLLLNVPNSINSDFSMHAIGNDLLLFLLTAAQYPKFAIVNEILSFFRAHTDSITLSASKGKIPLHYDLAKGYFVQSILRNEGIIRKLNIEFIIHLIKYKKNPFGIKSLSNFYPIPSPQKLDYKYLITRLMKIIRRVI